MKVIFAGEPHIDDVYDDPLFTGRIGKIDFDEDVDAVVYGCSNLLPGCNFDLLLKEPNLRGAIGLVVPPEAVCYSQPVRAKTAVLLNELLPRAFVMDELSKEWMLHWGISATVGGHPAWLRDYTIGSLARTVLAPGVVREAHAVEEAFAYAASQVPFILFVPSASTWAHVQEHPLVRWAATYDSMFRLALDGETRAKLMHEAEVDPGRFTFKLERLQLERERARQTLRELCGAVSGTSTVAGLVDGVLGASQPQPQPPPVIASGGDVPVRRMTPGDVFDPATHYDAAYYDGIIHYPRPDGSWATYRGPARDWEGFTEAAQAFDSVLRRRFKNIRPPAGPVAVDIGCGAGSFVERMVHLGWDAYGLDISESAVRGAKPSLRERLKLADLSKPEQLPTQPARLVTALDFWEHIFEEDLDALVSGVKRLLLPGGLHVAIICTGGKGEAEFAAERGVRVSKDNAWALVSGHVHLRRWGWWAKYFAGKGFLLRGDLADLILVRLAEGPMRQSLSWSARNLLVVQNGRML